MSRMVEIKTPGEIGAIRAAGARQAGDPQAGDPQAGDPQAGRGTT